MKFTDMISALLIIVIFLLLYVFSILAVGIKNIKKDWPEYRCNPMIMPFASYFGYDPTDNFTSCIASTMSGLMGFFLAPLNFLLSMLGGLGGVITEAIQGVRELQNFIRNAITGIITDVMGIFMNILIQFQKLIMGVKDLTMKMLGVAAVVMHLISGSIILGKSIWNGPIGSVLRTLCFSPNTKIKLASGQYVKMKNINLGDTLCNGAMVLGVLRLKGDKCNPYYRLWSDELNDYIYATGEHRILSSNNDTFDNYIQISDYEKAEKTTLFDKELSCLITSNHRIPIGEYLFLDWEDED